MPEIRLFPPLLGVSEVAPLSDQEEATARDAENVQTPEPSTGRMRLSKRPGLPKFISPSTQSGTAKIRDLGQLVVNDLTTDYAALTNPTEEWQTTKSTQAGGAIVRVSPRGDVFVLDAVGGDTVTRLNADGEVVSQIPLDNNENVGAGPNYRCLAVGNDDSFVAAIGDAATGATGSFIRIVRYALGTDGDYFQAWKIMSGDDAPNNAVLVKAICIKKGRLYTVQQTGGGAATALRLRVYSNIYTLVTPKLAVDYTFVASALNNEVRGIDVDDAGNVFVVYLADLAGTSRQHLTKISANNSTIWTINSSAADGSIPVNRGGLGNDVKVRGGFIWTLGFPDGANQQWLSKYADGLTAPTHVWSKTDAQAESKDFVTMVADTFFNIHAPFPTASALTPHDDLYGYDTDGNELYSFEVSATTNMRAVAIPPTNPNFSNSAASPERPEFIYFTTQAGNYFKYRLISATPSSGSPRTFINLKVVDTDIKTFTASAQATVGAGMISSDSDYVQSVSMLSKWYVTDGVRVLVYDPEDGTVAELLSSTSGLIPKRCSLIDTWRSRLVLAGDRDNRHAVYLSGQGDATDWDFFPPTPNSKQAVYTTLMAQTDEPADIINALVPGGNDYLLLGGERTIQMLRGDPAAGGTMDTITNQVGMAFGRPYCWGPDGDLFFFASEGGVHVMPGGLSVPQAISDNRLPRALRDIDLGTFYVRMAWVPRMRGLLVVFCPRGAGGTSTRAWFMSADTGAWWPWRFGTTAQTGVQPTALFTFDSDDPDERTVVLGCEDSYVRKLSESIAYDELASGSQGGIGAYVLLGPFQAPDRIHKIKARSIWGTLTSSGQAVWQLFAPPRPDTTLSQPAEFGVLPPGFSGRIATRTKGRTLYLKLTDYAAAMPWAIESLALDAQPSGKERVRL